VIHAKKKERSQVFEELVEQNNSPNVKVNMPYCNFANHDCPVKWAVLGLREGIFPEESDEDKVNGSLGNQINLDRLCDLVDGIIDIGRCLDGPEIEFATKCTVFVRCLNTSADTVATVTGDAFDLHITTVESPNPEAQH
jgi:hypothetical protein